MEDKSIDLGSLCQFKMACEDFTEQLRAKLEKKSAASAKLLNVSFAVLFVFLSKLAETPSTNSTTSKIPDDFRQVIEQSLANDFFAILAQTPWEMFSSERETQFLLCSILTKFFLKHEISFESSLNFFRFVLDQTLCECTLRVTDWDI